MLVLVVVWYFSYDQTKHFQFSSHGDGLPKITTGQGSRLPSAGLKAFVSAQFLTEVGGHNLCLCQCNKILAAFI